MREWASWPPARKGAALGRDRGRDARPHALAIAPLNAPRTQRWRRRVWCVPNVCAGSPAQCHAWAPLPRPRRSVARRHPYSDRGQGPAHISMVPHRAAPRRTALPALTAARPARRRTARRRGRPAAGGSPLERFKVARWVCSPARPLRIWSPDRRDFSVVPAGPTIGPMEEDGARIARAKERLARAKERLAGAIAIKHERERRPEEAQTCEEEAQAKLRVHLTPRQSDGRISNSLGMDGWANISLAVLLQMSDDKTISLRSRSTPSLRRIS